MAQIFARHNELSILDKLHRSGKPEFLAIFGRRRVGKTFLIREFFKDKGVYFHLTGIKDAPIGKQLRNFIAEFKRVFGSPPAKPPKDWQDAFSLLREAIDELPGPDRIILFFDELPWLASRRSGFLQDLDHIWNRHLSSDNRIVLIVCGSAAAWMIRKVIRHKGGLHGRLTASMRLMPFDLSETEQFLRSQNVFLDRRQIIDLYMAFGGVPKYLTYVERGLSSSQIINKVCFSGPLLDEFEELYSSLFENHENHVAVIRALASRNQGLTKIEIADATGRSPGGGLNKILDELEQSGFVLLIPDLGKAKKDIRYRLSDEYSLFYLRWIERSKTLNIGGVDARACRQLPNLLNSSSFPLGDDSASGAILTNITPDTLSPPREKIISNSAIRQMTTRPNIWLNVEGSPEARAWAGYTFEGICMKHIAWIKKALGIAGVLTYTSGWIYRPKKGSSENGAQADLVIDRADNCINLCEIKFSSNLFVISKAYEKDLRQRKAIFIEKTHSKKSVFLTFITLYGVDKEAGHFGIVDKELTMDDFFSN